MVISMNDPDNPPFIKGGQQRMASRAKTAYEHHQESQWNIYAQASVNNFKGSWEQNIHLLCHAIRRPSVSR
jgi:hypothetical protein